MWLFILSAGGALLISGFCSLMEATLLSLRPGQIAEISSRKPRIGRIWQRLKSDIERPIAAILILNTAAHTIGASVAGSEFGRLYGEKMIWVFSLVFTFLMLQFTEILPKGAGVRYGMSVAFWIARPLAVLTRVMRPLQLIVKTINLPFGGTRPPADMLTASDEITALSDLARSSGEMSIQQERIIRRGTRLSESKVRDVMRPRVDIDALEIDTPAEEIVGAVAMSGFSRVPVYEGDIDAIIGFIYMKDLLLELHMGRKVELRKLLRKAPMVPETLRLDQLVEIFRQENTQMAIVLDEYGGTEGLVTLQDVLEEVFGEIDDEHRPEEAELVRRDENSWLAIGSASVNDLLETMGRANLRDEVPDDISTVAGLIQSQLDRIAQAGDRTAWKDLSMEVLDVDGLRIDHVLVAIAPPEREPAGDENAGNDKP